MTDQDCNSLPFFALHPKFLPIFLRLNLEVHFMVPNRQFLTKPHFIECLIAFLIVLQPKLSIYPAQWHFNSNCIPSVLLFPSLGYAWIIIICCLIESWSQSPEQRLVPQGLTGWYLPLHAAWMLVPTMRWCTVLCCFSAYWWGHPSSFSP